MKKPFLLLTAFIPLFASCNKSGSFPNPFAKEDNYTRIGFDIADAEKITRPLTTTETNLVRDTIEGKDTYDEKIKSNKDAYRETRDYTRAFAGEFKQGYNVSNMMKREKFTVNAQSENEEKGTGTYGKRARLRIQNSIETTTQYSYGEIKSNVNQTDYYYYFDDGATSGDNGEATDRNASDSVNKRSTKANKTTDELIVKKESVSYKDDADKKYLQLHQSDYIFMPDAKCGANNKNEIILVAASQVKHVNPKEEDKGFFILSDGRKYQAMDNSLTVTKLSIVKDKSNEEKDWCLASYVRLYKETVITSEVIQPNVQVKKLASPITISFTEEVNHFSTDYTEMKDVLPSITVWIRNKWFYY